MNEPFEFDGYYGWKAKVRLFFIAWYYRIYWFWHEDPEEEFSDVIDEECPNLHKPGGSE